MTTARNTAEPVRQVALVTGGGTGIGRECVLRLASSGFDVVINYSRSQLDAEKTAEDAVALGARALPIRADVANDQDVRAMITAVSQDFGRLDVLINSAGATTFVDESALDDLEDWHWQQVMSVNVQGLFQSCRAAASLLRESRGAIVNVGSTAGLFARGSSIAYVASKAGAHAVSRALARILAPDVRVNAVAPGVVDTRWVSGFDDHVKRLSAGTPLGRVCTAGEVADVIVFLATDAKFVTGQTIIIDGGMFT